MHPIMTLYRQHELHALDHVNFLSQHDEQVWRHISKMTKLRMVHDWQPGRLSLEQLLVREKSLAAKEGQELEWKWYSALDEAGQLASALADAGFNKGEDEAFMVAGVNDLSFINHDLAIHKAESYADLKAIFAVQEEVWQRPMGERLQAAYASWLDYPESCSYYWVEIDGHAVSCAWVDYTDGSPFAGLWAGSTLADYRHRGCYQALVQVRAEEAKQRGRQFLTIDAMHTSEPIVSKMGFIKLSSTRPYTC